MVSFDNPKGRVTNSDLEHAAVLAHTAIQCATHDCRYITIATGSDNTPAVARSHKGAISARMPAIRCGV